MKRLHHVSTTWHVLLLGLAVLLSSCADNAAKKPAEPQDKSAAEASVPSENTQGVAKAAEPAKEPKEESQLAPAYNLPLSADEVAAGWISLFDGATLFGLQPNNDAAWKVTDGVIAADPAASPGLLLTTARFADYELRCDFKLEPGGNSGIFLRTPADPKDPASDCYELNICDSHGSFPTGSLVGREKIAQPVATDGSWHRFHVRLEGPHITVALDDKAVLEYEDKAEKPLSAGFIGLQVNKGHVEFRDFVLKPLGMQSLFNGKDLTGWRVIPGSKSKFEVKEEVIQVTGGRGFLETEKPYADFIFQADAITHGDELNSGYFFRTIQGTEQAPDNGYEVQIHNGMEEGDPNRPNNFGTGAIFRRVKARRVISKDHEWFTTTLVADGPHLSVWVNGYAVTDWTDTRPPHENPRKGLRTEAGHITLQGHDPTTDLSFRNLKIAPLP